MKQDSVIKNIIILGGGSAGWIVAGTIAAKHGCKDCKNISITLIESPDVKSIGVGEGTWPTMRSTLNAMGISETEFVRSCDVSFKQGSKFVNWVNGEGSDYYYHPMVLPQSYADTNLVPFWQKLRDNVSFADAVSSQSQLCDNNQAPKQITTPEYGYAVNYAYHLDAGKFADLLKTHCVEQLGVAHIVDHVKNVNVSPEGDIQSLGTQGNGDIHGDLFIDCSGFSSVLIDQHYHVPFKKLNHILFNDTALAAQVPYKNENVPIASCTISTAQSAGWIWDIGLQSRRGVGSVFSSSHINVDDAQKQLVDYLKPSMGAAAESVSVRELHFNPGYRETPWVKNCVAVGMASGFIEPLEASALVMVELSATMISDELPATRSVMDIVAKRFNEKFRYRWERIVDFLKLHYVLSQRSDSEYWRDNRLGGSIPDSLRELLYLWKHHVPWHYDFDRINEVFSSASYQYVLYGMGFETATRESELNKTDEQKAYQCFLENRQKTEKILGQLPTNRDLLSSIQQYGMQKI